MNARDGNALHILVIAVSSERRTSLAAIIGKVAHARATTASGISLERILQSAPDAIVVDIDGSSLSNAVIRLAEALPPGTGLIALVDNSNPGWVAGALRVGVNAILSREIASEEMKLAILAAEAGLVLLHPTSAQHLGGQTLLRDTASPDLVEPLTAREQEVLRMVSEGLGNKEIAARLSISDHTVKFHISSILGKLGASSRTEAVSQGIRRGLIAI